MLLLEENQIQLPLSFSETMHNLVAKLTFLPFTKPVSPYKSKVKGFPLDLPDTSSLRPYHPKSDRICTIIYSPFYKKMHDLFDDFSSDISFFKRHHGAYLASKCLKLKQSHGFLLQ